MFVIVESLKSIDNYLQRCGIQISSSDEGKKEKYAWEAFINIVVF